jgi:NAD(P)-dependent dehydrogenase (short-subunit alcohol dehydrogenase family)
MKEMRGQVIIVTGGTRGQDETKVRLLVEEGAQVVFGGRDEVDGQRIADELGSQVRFRRQDVGVEADWVALVAYTEAEFGKITGLVNNAGVTISGGADGAGRRAGDGRSAYQPARLAFRHEARRARLAPPGRRLDC